MSGFKLGERVRITGTVCKRRSLWDRNLTYEDAPVPKRSVDRLERVDGKRGTRWTSDRRPLYEGIIVGKRTAQPGSWVYEGGLPVYTPSRGESFPVWLVAVALDRKPVMCRVEQIERVGS